MSSLTLLSSSSFKHSLQDKELFIIYTLYTLCIPVVYYLLSKTVYIQNICSQLYIATLLSCTQIFPSMVSTLSHAKLIATNPTQVGQIKPCVHGIIIHKILPPHWIQLYQNQIQTMLRKANQLKLICNHSKGCGTTPGHLVAYY